MHGHWLDRWICSACNAQANRLWFEKMFVTCPTNCIGHSVLHLTALVWSIWNLARQLGITCRKFRKPWVSRVLVTLKCSQYHKKLCIGLEKGLSKAFGGSRPIGSMRISILNWQCTISELLPETPGFGMFAVENEALVTKWRQKCYGCRVEYNGMQ